MDNSTIVGAIALFALMLVFSAFFSACETAYTGVKVVRIKNLANEGNVRAQKALKILDNYDDLLVTILVGNNFVNIFASSVMAALCTEWFGGKFDGIIIVVISTLISLFTVLLFGEITPKTLAKKNAEKLVLRSCGIMSVLMVIFKPLSFLFTKPKQILEGDDDDQPSVTEEELAVLVDEIEEQGELEAAESKLIKSALEFDDKQITEILIPRVDIYAVPLDIPIEELKESMLRTGFSRIPLYKGTIDNIVGIIYRKDFFVEYFESKDFRLEDIARPASFLPETATIQVALTTLQKSAVHMLVVVDEFGGTEGIVTMEDVLEALIGDVYDETDEKHSKVVRSEDGTFAALGDADMDEVFETIGTEFDLGGYDGHTLSGYIQFRLNRIPVRGDRVIVNPDVKIIVGAVAKRRVKRAQIVVRAKEPEAVAENPE